MLRLFQNKRLQAVVAAVFRCGLVAMLVSECIVLTGIVLPECSLQYPLSLILPGTIIIFYLAIAGLIKQIYAKNRIAALTIGWTLGLAILWATPRYAYFFPWDLLYHWRVFIAFEVVCGGLYGLYAGTRLRVMILPGLLLPIAANLCLLAWLIYPGSNRLPEYGRCCDTVATPFPWLEKGDLMARELEYGRESSLRTNDADIPEVGGSAFDMAVRKLEFGLTPTSAPVRGELILPVSREDTLLVAPLVVILHGSHFIPGDQHRGYAYIADYLASKGYATMLVDANCLNDRWSGTLTHGSEEARAMLLVRNIEWLRSIQIDGVKINFNDVTLIGHSLGGRAVTAAYDIIRHRSDSLCNISGIIEFAPYRIPGACAALEPVTDVNYMLLGGGADTDVYYFSGLESYNSLIKPSQEHWKLVVYVFGATHSAFSTDFSFDRYFPYNLLEERGARLDAARVQNMTVALIGTFLEASVRANDVAKVALADVGWLRNYVGNGGYLSTWRNADELTLLDFEKGRDPDIVDITQRNGASTPAGNRMLRLARAAEYTLAIPAGDYSGVSLDIFPLDEGLPDVYLVMDYGGNTPVNDTVGVALTPKFHIKAEKTPAWLPPTVPASRDYEIVPETVRIPFAPEKGSPVSITLHTRGDLLIDNVFLW